MKKGDTFLAFNFRWEKLLIQMSSSSFLDLQEDYKGQRLSILKLRYYIGVSKLAVIHEEELPGITEALVVFHAQAG